MSASSANVVSCSLANDVSHVNPFSEFGRVRDMTVDPVSTSDATLSVLPVDFSGAHGTRLRGDLYLPASGAAPYPGLVMAHGFSATRRMGLADFAQCFAAAGIAVLAYDHRNL